nr:pentapeptide repeat-containing protein [uncultured Cohaesibacter sp.]
MTRSYILRKKKNMRSRASNRLKAQKVEIVEPTATILRKEVKRSTIWRVFEFAGIIAALVGLGVAISDNRVAQESLRLAREENKQSQIVQSWQIVTTKAPGNSGKKEALEVLNSAGQSLMNVDLSCRRMDGFTIRNNKLVCTHPTILKFVELDRADLSNSDLSYANMTAALLRNANLLIANLEKTWLWGANLTGADLRAANLESAILKDAHLSSASLVSARMKDAVLVGTNISATQFCGEGPLGPECVHGLTQDQVDQSWAWMDKPPVFSFSTATLNFKFPILCDTGLRAEYEKSQMYGVPKGCN